MLILAHRGYHATQPENTLEAFSKAEELGVQGIETDVRLSADGLPVLVHDRHAPNGVEVASLTQRELCTAFGHQVPTLDLVLTTWPHLFWNLEIKTHTALSPSLRALRALRDTRVLLTSFHHEIVLECARRLKYEAIEYGILLASRPRNLESLISLLSTSERVDTVVWHYEVLDKLLLDASADKGINHFAYGPETPDEHERCDALGLCGVITDFPQLLLAFRRAKKESAGEST
jgi:glycerophosphoryl diester phosphodiesterase